MKRVPIPQAYVIEQRFVFGQINTLFRLGLEIDLVGALVDTVGGAGGRNVTHDERALEGDFAGSHICSRYDGRNHVAQNERQHYQQCQPPLIGEQGNGRKDAAYDKKPHQRNSDVLIDVIDAHHEASVLIQQHAVTAQEKAHCEGQ